jgi:hypothetical protein
MQQEQVSLLRLKCIQQEVRVLQLGDCIRVIMGYNITFGRPHVHDLAGHCNVNTFMLDRTMGINGMHRTPVCQNYIGTYRRNKKVCVPVVSDVYADGSGNSCPAKGPSHRLSMRTC